MSAKPAPLPGWKNLPIGCHVQAPLSARNPHPGSWRSSRPLWAPPRCVKCGVCGEVCKFNAVSGV